MYLGNRAFVLNTLKEMPGIQPDKMIAAIYATLATAWGPALVACSHAL
jgi:hypothetical protein